MAAGTPNIAREGEGGAELIEEYGTGFLCKPEEGAAEIAEKVVALRGYASRYHALSGKCKKTKANEFSLWRFGQRLIELYHHIMVTR